MLILIYRLYSVQLIHVLLDQMTKKSRILVVMDGQDDSFIFQFKKFTEKFSGSCHNTCFQSQTDEAKWRIDGQPNSHVFDRASKKQTRKRSSISLSFERFGSHLSTNIKFCADSSVSAASFS